MPISVSYLYQDAMRTGMTLTLSLSHTPTLTLTLT